MRVTLTAKLTNRWPSFLDRIRIWSVGFCGGRKTEEPGEKPSEQGREPTTNSTHIWRRVQESNPGHSGGRRTVLSERFEVGVYLLVAPFGADKNGPKAPFPLLENAGIQPGKACDSQDSTHRSSGGSWVLLKALGVTLTTAPSLHP